MTDSVDEFLAHVGVKGMKWGVRRAAKKAEVKKLKSDASDKGYSANKQRFDAEMLGNRGVKNVSKRVVAGEKIGSARAKEYGKAVAISAAILATPIAIGATSRGLSSLSSNINAKRGAAEAAKILADTRGVTSYNTIALAFDSVTKTFR